MYTPNYDLTMTPWGKSPLLQESRFSNFHHWRWIGLGQPKGLKISFTVDGFSKVTTRYTNLQVFSALKSCTETNCLRKKHLHQINQITTLQTLWVNMAVEHRQFQQEILVNQSTSYCWWKKSCTIYQVVVYITIYKVLYIPGGCLGFLPTVGPSLLGGSS